MLKGRIAHAIATAIVALGLLLVAAPLSVATAAGKKEAPQEWDGLARVPSKKLVLVYVRPGASLAGY